MPSPILVVDESANTAATPGSWLPATMELMDPNEKPAMPIFPAGTPCSRTQSQAPRTSRYSSLPPAKRASSPSESPWSRRSMSRTEKPALWSMLAARSTDDSRRQDCTPCTRMTAGPCGSAPGIHQPASSASGICGSRDGNVTSCAAGIWYSATLSCGKGAGIGKLAVVFSASFGQQACGALPTWSYTKKDAAP